MMYTIFRFVSWVYTLSLKTVAIAMLYILFVLVWKKTKQKQTKQYCWRIGCGDGGRSPFIERMINETKIFDLYPREKRKILISTVNQYSQALGCDWLKNIFKRYQQKQFNMN